MVKGKDMQVEVISQTVEEKAKKIITRLYEIIEDRKEKVKEAEKKLAEVLEKEIELIEEKDGREWEWD